MLDHESQWLLRSAFIRSSFIPLTALAMMVMEITQLHPYHGSDASHFHAIYFCLVFIVQTLPLDSSPTEYQINSFCDSQEGFPLSPRWQALQHGGKTTKLNPEAAADQNPWKTAPDNQDTPRLRHGAGFTGWTMPKSAAHSKPELCYSLGINSQQQICCLPPALHAEVSIKKGFRLI